MKRKQSIELLKLIAAFFIVIIHSDNYSDSGFIMSTIARFAVPVLFMITGYYIIQPNNTSVKLKNQIIKLAKYYILYELIYILYYSIIALVQNNFQIFEYNFIENLKYILISPTIGYHLWYVINIIWVLLIIYLFNYFNKLKILFVSSIILHFIGIFISNFSIQLFNQVLPFYATRNFLFFGLFYVMLGVYIRKVDITKIRINNKVLLVVSIFMCLLQVVERLMWTRLFNSTFGEYFITTIIASVSIFIFTLRSNIDNRVIEKISRYSMPIYFLQILVIELIRLLCSYLVYFNIFIDLDTLKNTFVGDLVFVLMVCLLSCVLYDISKKLFYGTFGKIIKPKKMSL